ncbi:MAG: stage III sporulation protein AC [Clostridia bacterium]|nr:stage III sporulation protein AC [Clostridia bacterium]
MEVGILFKIATIGIIVAILNQVLVRSGRDEYTMITTLAGLIIVLMMLIPSLKQLFDYIETVFDL